jgi:class 3 adenylate cyclase
MMRLSVTLVVAGLLVLTAVSAFIIAYVPALTTVQNTSMDFVLRTAAARSENIQEVVSHRFRSIRQGTETLYRAVSQKNLLANGNPIDFAVYAAPFAAALNVAPHLVRSDAYSVSTAVANTVTNGPDAPDGFVHLLNITTPGTLINIGQFSLFTYVPLNQTQPYMSVYTYATYFNQPVAVDIMNLTSHSSAAPVRWTRLAPRNTARAPSSIIAFGGPLYHPTAANPLDRVQYFGVNERGEVLGAYFSGLNISAHGIAILVDVKTRAYAAGNVADATAQLVDGVPTLIPLNNITDSRVSHILHLAAAAAAALGGDGDRSGSVFLTCDVPCTFTYWPSKNDLVEGSQWNRLRHPVLFQHFSSIRVVEVSDDLGLEMRIVVIIPSDDVLKLLGAGVLAATIAPTVLVGTLGIVCVVLSWYIFRNLRTAELVLNTLSTTSLMQSRGTPSVDAKVLSDLEAAEFRKDKYLMNFNVKQKSYFVELQRIDYALVRLIKELKLLRAFSRPGAALVESSSSASSAGTTPDSRSGRRATTTTVNVSALLGPSISKESDLGDASHNDSLENSKLIPYNFKTLWRVPVTTMCVELAGLGNLQSLDPTVIFTAHQQALDVLQKCMAQHATGGGVSLDLFYGDRFLVHFNASHRTPRHAVLAVDTALAAASRLRGLPTGISARFGVATQHATCGLMGPREMKQFTVVSNVDAQAIMMASLSATDKFTCLMTWRCAEIVRQQDTVVQQRASERTRIALAVAIYVILPGETAVTAGFKPTCKRFLSDERE